MPKRVDPVRGVRAEELENARRRLAMYSREVKALPRGQLKVLTDCGHVPQDERPEAVLELIESFLRG